MTNLPQFLLEACVKDTHTNSCHEPESDTWIVIQPKDNKTWCIQADVWRCIRFNLTREEITDGIQIK